MAVLLVAGMLAWSLWPTASRTPVFDPFAADRRDAADLAERLTNASPSPTIERILTP